MSVYFVCDEDGYREYPCLADALEDAEESINIARDLCDPEWPEGVSGISIYKAPTGCECPDEDGKLIYRATEFNVRDAEEGSGCDYFCDYRMEAQP